MQDNDTKALQNHEIKWYKIIQKSVTTAKQNHWTSYTIMQNKNMHNIIAKSSYKTIQKHENIRKSLTILYTIIHNHVRYHTQCLQSLYTK